MSIYRTIIASLTLSTILHSANAQVGTTPLPTPPGYPGPIRSDTVPIKLKDVNSEATIVDSASPVSYRICLLGGGPLNIHAKDNATQLWIDGFVHGNPNCVDVESSKITIGISPDSPSPYFQPIQQSYPTEYIVSKRAWKYEQLYAWGYALRLPYLLPKGQPPSAIASFVRPQNSWLSHSWKKFLVSNQTIHTYKVCFYDDMPYYLDSDYYNPNKLAMKMYLYSSDTATGAKIDAQSRIERGCQDIAAASIWIDLAFLPVKVSPKYSYQVSYTQEDP